MAVPRQEPAWTSSVGGNRMRDGIADVVHRDRDKLVPGYRQEPG
jgi:hypothetical protein